ncbi:Ribosomal small subunit pseudouridine synthase A [bioreactor metagenome]|uniref:Ribosomal small subunit pseudouridine synthase A n=1 Tax=bioreactor metagenome TaxID=1076179 RepID=A0A645ES15_9ZZZZ
MNKPAGIVCATEDPAQKTVIDILEEPYRHMKLFPAGRLDKDTVGLLLLTNDGEFAHSMLSPQKHVYKTYYAKVSGAVTEEDVWKFKEGLIISGEYKTMPARLDMIRSGNISEVKVMIREGKFHQVKRMFESVNKKVLYLKRIQIGSYLLDEDLPEGQSREIDKMQASKMLENPPIN